MTDISDRKDMNVVLAAWSPAAGEPRSEATSSQGVQSASNNPTRERAASSHPPSAPIAPASREQGRDVLRLDEGLSRLAHDILARGGYGAVEVGYCYNGHPSVEEAIERAITRGARRVVVVPMIFALGISHPLSHTYTSFGDLPARISKMQACHPGIDIVYAGPPFDHERQVDLILSKIREYEPETLRAGLLRLNSLAAGQAGTVRQLDGGSRFRSRMASLGFTPGATVKMIRNYGHGAVIVSLRGSRVALGRGEARKVGVSVASKR